MRRRSTILCVLLLSAGLFADPGSSSFETLNLAQNARYFGMAGAGTAAAADVSACLINPAGLVHLESLEIGVNGKSHVWGSLAGSVSLGYPMPFGTFGLSFSYLNYGSTALYDDIGTETGSHAPGDAVFGLSFANGLNKYLAYGINLRYLQSVLAPDHSLAGFSGDLGILVQELLNGLRFSLCFNNMGMISTEEFRDNDLPLTIILGAAWVHELKKPVLGVYDIGTILDLEFDPDNRFRVNTGLEFWWHHILPETSLCWRAGITAPADAGVSSGLRTGLGFSYKKIILDYGAGYMEDSGLLHMLSMTYRFKPPPPPRYIEKISPKNIEKTLKEFDSGVKGTEKPEGTVTPPDGGMSFEETDEDIEEETEEFDFEEE